MRFLEVVLTAISKCFGSVRAAGRTGLCGSSKCSIAREPAVDAAARTSHKPVVKGQLLKVIIKARERDGWHVGSRKRISDLKIPLTATHLPYPAPSRDPVIHQRIIHPFEHLVRMYRDVDNTRPKEGSVPRGLVNMTFEISDAIGLPVRGNVIVVSENAAIR